MRQFLTVCAGAIALAASASADVVTDWNNTLLQAIRTDKTPPPKASRGMAMVSTAVYDAVMAIEKTHFPYHVNTTAPLGTSKEAAAAQAAHDVLVSLYPAQAATFGTALTNSLNAIPNGQGKTDGVSLGSSVASQIITLRANDNSGLVVPYTPGTDPGDWRPTPPTFGAALLPNWPQVTPWTMNAGSQFRPVAPPALTSAEYTAAFNEVKELGRIDSATRTADQTEIAQFWADGGGTETPPGHWNAIAQDVAASEGNSLAENARMFALMNLATADAAIVAWDAKYEYNHWRPYTGITEADTDGNPDTIDDDSWLPLIATPPFPAYTSGHSTFSAAASVVLAGLFGDDTGFTTDSDGLLGALRSFTSFSEAAEEAGQSRIYGGIHWQYDNTAGLSSGRALAQYILDNFLRPVPEPSSLLLLGSGLALIARRRR